MKLLLTGSKEMDDVFKQLLISEAGEPTVPHFAFDAWHMGALIAATATCQPAFCRL